jgi:hypothetical protein
MAKIQIQEGKWNSECTTELNLTNSHAIDPNAGYDKVIMYAEKRHLMTFLTAGATNGKWTVARTTEAYKTEIPSVPEGELIDGKAWKYRIMGRIQKASVIVGTGAVGTITAGTQQTGGTFYIALRDNMLYPGMNVIFYNGKMARIQGMPTGGPSNYIYKFMCFPGETFEWATWIAPQVGEKTCFGGYSTYGERSLKGYGRSFFPDAFINHMTIQRKGAAITGDVNAERVLWYLAESASGSSGKGWLYWIEAQARAQFLLEDEFQKWWGKSTMKDSYGNLLSEPSMIDEETNMPLVAGDGYVEQIKGANDAEASGPYGNALWDDFADMGSSLKKKSNNDGGALYYVVTGTDGMQNTQTEAGKYAKDYLNFNVMLSDYNSQKVGGADVSVGVNFNRLNINGDSYVFCTNPMMDDEKKFPRRLRNGKLAMSSTYYFVDASRDDTGRRNIEMRTRGRESVNRNMVYFYNNGMTGDGTPMHSIDGKEFQMLKENMIVCYNSKSCGILSPSPTA